MFNSPGKKLKGLAKAAFIAECIASVLTAIYFLIEEDYLIAVAALVGGVVTAYVTSLFIFAFGELVENSSKPSAHSSSEERPQAVPASPPSISPEQKPAEPPQKTVSAEEGSIEFILKYSLEFTTVSGMRNYLSKAKLDRPEHREKLEWILRASDSTLRDTVTQFLSEL